MNWHTRYLQQAAWDKPLREYLFKKAGLQEAHRILEVGCGTGPLLREVPARVSAYGVDIDPAALRACKHYAPKAALTRGNAERLPFADGSFEVVYCHYLLLWVNNPLQAVQEMARVGRQVLALAEPDYSRRVDKPEGLKKVGEWQRDALARQGANPFFGAELAETFQRAGLEMVESGKLAEGAVLEADEGWALEWEVLEADVAGRVPAGELQKMRELDAQARKNGERVLYVPTYFAWGRVKK